MTSDTNEKIWTIQELEGIDPFDVVCLQCKSVFGSKSGAPDHSKIHNEFYKYDSKKEEELKKIKEKQAKLKEQEVILTEEYKIELKQKSDELKKETDKYGSKMYFAIVTGLSSLIQMKIQEERRPHTILFNGNSTNKEIITDSFKMIPDVIHVNSFTPKSFVTHSARHSTEKLKDIDLLPKIRNKGMFTSNADSIFLGNKPTVNNNITMFDTVLEGKGYESHSSVHAVRGYSGNHNFVWLGTINQINKRVFEAIRMMNNKPLFFKLDDIQKDNMADMIQSLSHTQDLLNVGIINAVKGFWSIISELFSDNEKRVMWDESKDDNKTRENIINLSLFLRDFRAYLPTTNTSESTSGGTNYNFEMPIKEDINKLSKTLYNLAQGHAIIHGRNYITNDDLEIIVHIVMSSLPQDRLDLFEILLCNDGLADTTQIEKGLSISKATALKEMEKLRVLGVVEDNKIEGKSKPMLSIQLKDEHHWILEDKFKLNLNKIIHIHTIDNSKLSNSIDNKDNLEKSTMKVCSDYITSKTYCKY